MNKSEAIAILGCETDLTMYVDSNGLYHDDLESLIQNGLFGFCMCGDPREELKKFREVLNNRENNIVPQMSDQIYLYILDKEQFTEHGSSVFGSWLTEKGKALLCLLNLWYKYDYEPTLR